MAPYKLLLHLLESYRWDVITSTGMVVLEGCVIGLTIMTKTTMARGMSSFVFVFYSNALASLILLPSLFFHRPKQSCFTFSFFFCKFFFLALTGITVAQNFAFAGLGYSSPILVCSMANFVPALSFLQAVISRKGKIQWRSSSIKAKSIGTLISIVGAIVVTFYKGPSIKKTSPVSDRFHFSSHQLLYASTPENWLLGAILLAFSSLSVSVWSSLQAGFFKEYSEATSVVVSFYSLFGTIQCGIVSLVAESDLDAWKLTNNIEVINIALTAMLVIVVRNSMHTWCMCCKGSVYVGLFKPFGIVFAVTSGVIFFGDSLHIGSVMGYYGVMWGLIKEEEMSEDDNEDGSLEPSIHKVPLLGDDEIQVW